MLLIEISTTWIAAIIPLLFLTLGGFFIAYWLLKRFRLARAGSSQYSKMGSLVRQPIVREKETTIIREKETTYKVTCPYCGKLYDEVFDVCPHCGGKR